MADNPRAGFDAGIDTAAMPDVDPAGDAEGATRLGVLDALVGYHLRRASSMFAQDFGRALAGTGIRQVPFGILSVIAANPGIHQGKAGRALGIQRANMVSLVNDLADGGLVRREAAAEDRRALALTLTPAGEATLATCLARIDAHEDGLMGDLSREDRAMLIRMLSRIADQER